MHRSTRIRPLAKQSLHFPRRQFLTGTMGLNRYKSIDVPRQSVLHSADADIAYFQRWMMVNDSEGGGDDDEEESDG